MLHLCTSSLDANWEVVSCHNFCGCQFVRVPSREEDSQVDKQLNWKSA